MTFSGSIVRPGKSNFGPFRPNSGEIREIVRLAWPIMLIALINMGMSVTDTAMVSVMFGTEALAGVAVGSDLYSIVFYLGAGVVAGVAPFYASAVARADIAEQRKLRQIGWWIVAGVSAITIPIVWTAPDWLAALGLDAGLLREGRGYTHVIAVTLIPMFGVGLFRTLLTSAQRPQLFLKVTVAMLPLNAVGNYVFMKGLGPVPSLGPTGAAVSTLLVTTATLAILFLIDIRSQHPEGVAKAHPRIDDVLSVLKVGLPIGISTIGEVGIFLAVTVYAGRLGAADVAAHALALRTAGVLYAVPAALLQASLVRIARLEDDDRAGQQEIKSSSILAASLSGALLCAGLVLGADGLAAVFFDGSAAGMEAAALAVGLLWLLGAMELAGNPGSAAAGLLRGRKDARVPMLISMVGQWAIGAPVGLALCELADLGIVGLWMGLLVGTIATSSMTLGRLIRT